MTETEVKENRTFIKIKGQDGIPALEIELASLASLIQFLNMAINTGQIAIETREVRVKKWVYKEIITPEGKTHG